MKQFNSFDASYTVERSSILNIYIYMCVCVCVCVYIYIIPSN